MAREATEPLTPTSCEVVYEDRSDFDGENGLFCVIWNPGVGTMTKGLAVAPLSLVYRLVPGLPHKDLCS